MFLLFFIFGSVLLHSCLGEQDHYSESSVRDGRGWGSDASSTFFDIALTALAFLSFGIFLLNLLLNAILFPTVATTAVQPTGPILTMITGDTGGQIVTGLQAGLNGLGGLGRRRRHRRRGRAIFTPEIDQATSMELFVQFVKKSIDTMSQRHECLPRVICDGNRQARIMPKAYKIFIPGVSLGLAYAGKMLGTHDDLKKYLDAILLGAREANCQSYFPKCKPSKKQ